MKKWLVLSAVAGAIAAGVVVVKNQLGQRSEDDIWTDATSEDVWPSA